MKYLKCYVLNISDKGIIYRWLAILCISISIFKLSLLIIDNLPV